MHAGRSKLGSAYLEGALKLCEVRLESNLVAIEALDAVGLEHALADRAGRLSTAHAHL